MVKVVTHHTKHDVRQSCFTYLKKIAKRPNRYALDKHVNRRLQSMIHHRCARRVMAYLPLPHEADIRPLLARLKRQGMTVYVPFMDDESFTLVQYRYPLKRKRFGVFEPKHKNTYAYKDTIDMALVPIIAVDKHYRRIGFGKGMYDRFFEKKTVSVREVVFVSRSLCIARHPVGQTHDVRANAIVSGD